MNSKRILATALYSSLLAFGMAGSAIAQSDTAKQDSATGTSGQPTSSEMQQKSQSGSQAGATDSGQATTTEGGMAQSGSAPVMERGLIGMEVRNGNDENLGEVSNVLVTGEGRIDAIVLSTGGVLGLGENRYVVPWDQVQTTPGQDHVMVDAPADQLEAEFSAFEPAPEKPATGSGGATGSVTGSGSSGATGATQQQQSGGATAE